MENYQPGNFKENEIYFYLAKNELQKETYGRRGEIPMNLLHSHHRKKWEQFNIN